LVQIDPEPVRLIEAAYPERLDPPDAPTTASARLALTAEDSAVLLPKGLFGLAAR
jgi:hypothetical protein